MYSLGKRKHLVDDSKTIRIWDGCKVIHVFSVTKYGASSTMGSVGGADNSIRVDIEIDPWRGFIVDHNIKKSPTDFHKVDDAS